MARSEAWCFVVLGFLVICSQCSEVEELGVEKPNMNLKPEPGKRNKALGLQGKPNNHPKDVHGDTYPGTAYPYGPKSTQGYPNHRSVKGSESKALLSRRKANLELLKGGVAEYPAFHPLKSPMTAKDIHTLAKPIAGTLKIAEESKRAEENLEDYQMKQFEKNMKKVAAGIMKPQAGVRLLDGKLLHQLGVQRGNVLNCESQLKECKASVELIELGESVEPVKHTAEQEDKIARGVERPGAEQRARNKKHPAKQIKRTALQDYIHRQTKSPYDLLDHKPGFKLSEDRLNARRIYDMIAALQPGIALAKAADKRSTARDKAQVEKANRESFAAEKAGDQAKAAILDAAKPQTSKQTVALLGKMSEKLNKCVKELTAKCPKLRKKLKLAVSAVPIKP